MACLYVVFVIVCDCNQYSHFTNPLPLGTDICTNLAAPPLLTPLIPLSSVFCVLCFVLLVGTNLNGQWSIDTWATVFEFQLAPGT